MKKMKKTKKRILAIILGLCATISLAGCGQKISNKVITIEQYKGLEIEKIEVAEVTDDDVENSIKTTIEQAGKTIAVTDRAVQNGDKIVLDYSGKLNGEVFDGGTAEDQTLTIGSGAFIPGFEEAIIGHKAGETFDINVTFPEDYGNEELNGQPVVFTITIDKITGYPELTEKLLAELDVEEKTVEDYKKRVKKDLETSNQQAVDSQLEGKAWVALMEKCVIEDYPEDKYTEISTRLNNQYNYYAQMYGMTVDQVIQATYNISLDQMIKEYIKQEYAVELIAKKEKMEITDKYYEERLEELAAQYGYTSPEEMETTFTKENLKQTMLQEKVGKFLVDNCKFVDKKADNSEE